MNSLLRRTCLLVFSLFAGSLLFAQKTEVPKGWHLMDRHDSGYYGISIDKAYAFIQSKKLN